MVRRFDGIDDTIKCAIGSCNTTGAYSLAILLKPTSQEFANYIVHNASGGGSVGGFGEVENALEVFTNTGSVSRAAFQPSDSVWNLLVVTKASGSAKAKFYKYNFTTAEWTTGEGTGSQGNWSSQASGSIWFGAWEGAYDFLSADVAAAANFAGTQLTEANLKKLATAATLEEWKSVTGTEPKGLWLFNQSSPSEELKDLIGAAHQSSITGTESISEEPPIPYKAGKTVEFSAAVTSSASLGAALVATRLFGATISATGTLSAGLVRTRLIGASVAAPSSVAASLVRSRVISASIASASEVLAALTTSTPGAEPQPFDPDYRPPLELDVEIETAEGAVFRLNANALDAGNRPQGITFGTQRGDGFGTASFTLSRSILRDYPDINLLDTVRFIGHQGDIAYEGRIHSFPKTNDPEHQIQISCVGWMTYLKGRPCSPLIIDRRLSSWGEMSLAQEAKMLEASYLPKQFASSQSDPGSSTAGPGIVFTCTTLVGTYSELGQQWFYGGGEDIAALRYSFEGHGLDGDWLDQAGLSEDDAATGFVGGTDHNGVSTANQEVLAGGSGKKYAVVSTLYGGASTGTFNIVHRWRHPRAVGAHGLTEIGTRPEEGYSVTDIGKYVVDTYYPKIDTSEIVRNPFPLLHATWHDAGDVDGYAILQQLNDLILAETNVWEERKLYWEQADLSGYDWVLSTGDPGVTVMWQGDSIENFANGVVVTYSDFFGHTYKLYPDDHAELADESEDNPASRHGENLWISVTMPWQGLEAEAIQFGRAYLAEYNRPKRPGTYRLAGGYIRDAAGHWRQGWQVRNSQTLGVLNHPQDFPRLITATGWSQDGLSLDITVDAPPSTLTAITARNTSALQARGYA